MNYEETMARLHYCSMANKAIEILKCYKEIGVSKGNLMKLRDEYKEKSDKEIRIKNSQLGRLIRRFSNEDLFRKYQYEVYDLILAHMNIQGVDRINYAEFACIVFKDELYEKYFEDPFIQFEKNNIEDQYRESMESQEQKMFIETMILQREKLIPKYGELKPIEPQEENE